MAVGASTHECTRNICKHSNDNMSLRLCLALVMVSALCCSFLCFQKLRPSPEGIPHSRVHPVTSDQSGGQSSTISNNASRTLTPRKPCA